MRASLVIVVLFQRFAVMSRLQWQYIWKWQLELLCVPRWHVYIDSHCFCWRGGGTQYPFSSPSQIYYSLRVHLGVCSSYNYSCAQEQSSPLPCYTAISESSVSYDINVFSHSSKVVVSQLLSCVAKMLIVLAVTVFTSLTSSKQFKKFSTIKN